MVPVRGSNALLYQLNNYLCWSLQGNFALALLVIEMTFCNLHRTVELKCILPVRVSCGRDSLFPYQTSLSFS